MKRNNVAKKLGIASLCLAFLIPVFSGITTNDNKVALAEGVTSVAVQDFLTASAGATVEHVLETDVTNGIGVRISSDVGYSATFNTVFNGNSVFKFRFPETQVDSYYGDFKFHIADATDPNNCFDIVYYVQTTSQTGIYVQWKDEIRMPQTSNASSTQFVNSLSGVGNNDMFFSPGFLSVSKSTSGTQYGTLSLVWKSGVLSVQGRSVHTATAAKSSNNYMKAIARFDGTYDLTASKNGFTGGSAMGLPKLSFPNGYTVTVSSYVDAEEIPENNASDVVFSEVRTAATSNSTLSPTYFIASGTAYKNCTKTVSGGVLYDLDSASVTELSDNYVKAYGEIEANAGKTLIGWKDDTGLYSTATALASADISAYTPVYVGYGMMNGASVRIDTSAEPQSGLRFMTTFNVSDYASVKDYITSCGTLIAYNSALTQGIFDTVNYADEITAKTQVAQVENTKGVFTYIDQNNNSYKAYSMALVGITDYTQVYAARGYIVVTYADETTATFYTSYNETNNNRSIAEVAYKLQQSEEFSQYGEAQQGVVNDFAAAYVAPEA